MTEKKPPAQPTPRRERRSRTAEEDSRAYAWKLLKEEVEKDPQLRERYIAQVTGFDIAKAHRGATEEKFRLELLKLGLKELEKEPDWAKDLAKDAMYEAMGKKRPEPEEAKPRETFEQYMERMLKIKDFIERMKPKPPGILEQIFTSENVVAFLQALQAWLSQSRGPQSQPPPGWYSNQTPPHQTTEEQTTASGFAGFGYEPPPPPPNARAETNRSNAASHFDSGPEYRAETNPNPDQSTSPASEAKAANPEAGAEPPQDETISALETNDDRPAEIWLSELNAKAAKAKTQLVNQTSVGASIRQPDQPELQEKTEAMTEVELPPNVTTSIPQPVRLKREKPLFDLDPDPVIPEDID